MNKEQVIVNIEGASKFEIINHHYYLFNNDLDENYQFLNSLPKFELNFNAHNQIGIDWR